MTEISDRMRRLLGQPSTGLPPSESDRMRRLLGQPSTPVGQPSTPDPLAPPEGVVNFFQGVQANPVGKFTLDVLGTIGTILQPLAAPQQILYGGISEIVEGAKSLFGQSQDYKPFENIGRGFTAAGSYLTYGAFDEKTSEGFNKTRGENAMSAIPTVSGALKSLGASPELSWIAGLVVDIVTDPANLAGGAGAAAKTGKVLGISAGKNLGAIKRLESALEAEALMAGKLSAKQAQEAREIAAANAAAGSTLERTVVSSEVGNIQAQFAPAILQAKQNLDLARLASTRERATIKMADRLIRFGNFGGLDLAADGINAVTGGALNNFAQAAKNTVSRIAETPLTYQRVKSRIVRTEAEAKRYNKALGERYTVVDDIFSGKREGDLPAGVERTRGGVIGGYLDALGIKKDITWGELFLQKKQLASLGDENVIAGSGAQGGRQITIKEARERQLRVEQSIGYAAADHLNRIGGEALETLQRLRAKIPFEDDYNKIQAALYMIEDATSADKLKAAYSAFNALTASMPAEVRQLALLARKQNNKTRAHGGALLGGQEPSRVPMPALTTQEYDEMVGALDNAPDTQTMFTLVSRYADDLVKRFTPDELGLRRNDITAPMSLADQVKVELIGYTVAGERMSGVGLSAAQVQLDPKLVEIAGKEFAESARVRFTKALPSERPQLARDISEEAVQEAYKQMRPHLDAPPKVAKRQLEYHNGLIRAELEKIGAEINSPSPARVSILEQGLSVIEQSLSKLKQDGLKANELKDTVRELKLLMLSSKTKGLQDENEILADLAQAREVGLIAQQTKLNDLLARANESYADVAQEASRTASRLETLAVQRTALKDTSTVVSIADREKLLGNLLAQDDYDNFARVVTETGIPKLDTAISPEQVLSRANKEIDLMLEIANASVRPAKFNAGQALNRMADLLYKQETELASLTRTIRLLKKKGDNPQVAKVERQLAQKAEAISNDVVALREFFEKDDAITKLLQLDESVNAPRRLVQEQLSINKAATIEARKRLADQVRQGKAELKSGEKFYRRISKVERTAQERTYRDMFSRIGNDEKIAKLQEKVAELLASPEPITPLDMRSILRADGLDDFADGLESMPSMVRREFALTDFGMPYINAFRLNTALEQPTISIDYDRLERLLKFNFPETQSAVTSKSGKAQTLATQITGSMQRFQNSKALTEAIKKVWSENPETGGGRGTNMYQLLRLVKQELNLDEKLMYRLFDEIVNKDQKIAKETRAADVTAKSLELSGYGRLGRGSGSDPTSAVGQRQLLDEATKVELGEYQNLAYSIEKNVAAVGRVVIERGARNELRSIVDDAFGGVFNLGQRNLPEEIDTLYREGNLVALEQGDAFEIFKRGDLVPPWVARDIQISNASGDLGKNGIFNFLSQTRAIFSGAKLGTVGSLVRQIIGGFALADNAGMSPIDLGKGIAKYFSEVGKAKKSGEMSAAYEELISSGAMHTNFFKSEQALTDNLLAEARATGDRRMNGLVQGMLNYKLEQTGAAKGVLADNPKLQQIAKLGGVEIGAGAAVGAIAGSTVLPVVGTAVGAAVGAAAGATAGGLFGFNRKMFEMFGAAEEMLRAGAYFAAREQGKSIADAAEFATETMYNYQARPVLAAAAERLGIPFQTFAAISTTKTLEQLFTRPTRLARTTLVGEKAERGREDFEQGANERISMPKWLKESMPIPLPFKDSDGRGYYLPLAPLVASQQLDNLFRGGDVKDQLQKTINGIPLAQLAYSIVANQKFNGAPVYSKNADSAEITAASVAQVLNTFGYPTQAGSPLMENLVKQALKFVETDESLAARFGADQDTVEAQMFNYSMAILENGYGAWGENSMPTRQSPNKAPSKDLAQFGSQVLGLTTQTVQGDAGKAGDRAGKIADVTYRLQSLEKEYANKLSSVRSPKEQEQVLKDFKTDQEKLIKELQLLTR